MFKTLLLVYDYRSPPHASKHPRMNGENQSVIHVSELAIGLYTFKLTVTDKQGATSSDTVDVTVKPGKFLYV